MNPGQLARASLAVLFLPALAAFTQISAAAQVPGPNQVSFAGKLVEGIGPDFQRVSPMAAGKLVSSAPLPVFPPSSSVKSGALVKLLVEVDDKGAVTAVPATDGPTDLAALASSAVQTWTFRPYMHAGQTAPMVTTIPLLFQPATSDQPAKVLYMPAVIRISGGVLAAQNEHKVIPQRISGAVSGNVVLQVLVDPHGYVAAATAISGPQPLHAPCEDAVSQWRYQPYLLNGDPVWVESTVLIRYNAGTPQ